MSQKEDKGVGFKRAQRNKRKVATEASRGKDSFQRVTGRCDGHELNTAVVCLYELLIQHSKTEQFFPHSAARIT